MRDFESCYHICSRCCSNIFIAFRAISRKNYCGWGKKTIDQEIVVYTVLG